MSTRRGFLKHLAGVLGGAVVVGKVSGESIRETVERKPEQKMEAATVSVASSRLFSISGGSYYMG